MDNRRLICFAFLALATAASHADGFFINTSLGVDNYYPQYQQEDTSAEGFQFHNHSTTEALRVGYRWTTGAFSYGLETGYVNLGPSYADYSDVFDPYSFTHFKERIDGIVLGPTLKYELPMGFFVSARGGFFRSTDHEMERSSFEPPYFFTPYSNEYRVDVSGIGSYVGLGLGYDFNQSLGLSLNYDRYRPHTVSDRGQLGLVIPIVPRVDTYTVTAEYRF